MRTSTTFDVGGAAVLLTRSLPLEQKPDEIGREACRVLGHALRFAAPLAVDLLMGARAEDEPFLDEGALLPHGTWHVAGEEAVARGLRPGSRRDGHQDRRVEEITVESVARVLAEAMAQPAPPERCVTLARLEIAHLRARLFDPSFASAAAVRVRRARFEYDVPIAHEMGGSWIDRVPEGVNPPLHLVIDNNDGAVRVKLAIAWSLWKDEGSPEKAAIAEFARAVAADGYAVEHLDREFQGQV
jgi:hypothetical protein